MNIEAKGSQLTSYIAVIIYAATSDVPNYQPLYEECFMLIKAASQEEARQKTVRYAQRQQTTYKNEQQEDIRWLLKQIIDINPVLTDNIDFEDGSELYARHFRNYQAYTAFEPLLSGGL
jgi:hypothetical protein